VAYAELGWLYRQIAQYDKAATSFDRAVALLEAATGKRPAPELTKAAKEIRDAREGLKLDSDMEKLWVRYLRTIQEEGTFPNWSSKPYDEYMKTHQLRSVP